jgi:O-acetyl-ADP-ribose deacetylase (regulator of RNase III)
MIHFTHGDILCDESEAIVNPVNCVGVMGRGLALQFRKAYPEVFKVYAEACKGGEVRPGHMFVAETGEFVPRYVIHFPTKRHWRKPSRMEDIESGLADLAQLIRSQKLSSVAVPALGAGLGGLGWPLVRERIVAALDELAGVRITIYEPISEVDPGPLPSRTATQQ